MSKLRRYPAEGRPSFITNVTFARRPLLIDNVDLLWDAFATVKSRIPFELLAWVILPDHFHIVIDPKENDLSRILQRIKMSFAASWRKRKGRHSGRVWQHRFWDHVIRDQDDWNRHIDYIHYNPARHGLVRSPFDWTHSSIHEYREQGFYAADWGVRESPIIDGEFGE